MDYLHRSQEPGYHSLRGEDHHQRRPSLLSPEAASHDILSPGSTHSGHSAEPLFAGYRAYRPPGQDTHSEPARSPATFPVSPLPTSYTAVPSDTDLTSSHDYQVPLRTYPSGPPASSSTGEVLHWKALAVEKWVLVLASLIPFAVSAALLVETVRYERSNGSLLYFVINNRATAQIVVSIVSALLATFNVYTVTQLINLAMRIGMLRRSLTLDGIKFLSVITSRRWIIGLPFHLFLGAALIGLCYALPNVLWTGSLTPVLVSSFGAAPAALLIPQYSAASAATWSNNNKLAREDCRSTVNKFGVFGNCATTSIQSNLLSKASQATVNKTALGVKNDFSHYSFIGRSYGVGSSVGLTDQSITEGAIGDTLMAYSYTEPGYLTSVQCALNASTNYQIQSADTEEDSASGNPTIYQAMGWFPWENVTQSYEHFAVVAFNQSDLAVITSKRSPAGINMIIGVAGNHYPLLNDLQCEIQFEPTTFNVSVDIGQRLIRVEPVPGALPPSFDPTAGLAETAVAQLNVLGMISTSLYTSIVGDALMANVNASTSQNAPQAQKYAAVADSFAAMFDDIFGYVASSQLFIPFNGAGDSTSVDLVLEQEAVVLGEKRYVAAVFGMCALLLLALLIEAARTVGWRMLPRWDPQDSTCLVLAGAVAGDDLLRRIPRTHGPKEGTLVHSRWEGDGREALGGMRMRLGQKIVRKTEAAPYADMDDHETCLTAVSLWTPDAREAQALR